MNGRRRSSSIRCGQVALGGAAIVAPEPTVTKVVGGALVLRGVDNCQAGVRQMISGQATGTWLGGKIQKSLSQVTTPEKAAEYDMYLEMLLDTSLTAGASQRGGVSEKTPAPRSRR